MCDGLCVRSYCVMVLVRQVYKSGTQRFEDAFHQLERIIWSAVLNQNLTAVRSQRRNTRAKRNFQATYKGLT